jgi:hypothetical protein
MIALHAARLTIHDDGLSLRHKADVANTGNDGLISSLLRP